MSRWPKVALGEVLTKSGTWIRVDPEAEYKEVRACLWGKGLVLRRVVAGSEIASSRRLQVRAGQFLVSRIDARHGAAGLIPDELDGAVVSNDYPAFDVDERRLVPAYLGWYSKTAGFVDACRHASEGTTNRVRLQEQRFLDLTMPLPPIEEQRRVVRKIEQLAAQVATVGSVYAALDARAESLCRSLVTCRQEDTGTPLRELLSLRTPDVEVRADERYEFAGVYCFGRGVFRGDVKSGSEFSYPRLTRLHAGDFVYPKLMAWEGAFGVVPVSCEGCVVSTEFPVFEIDERRVFHEVVDVWFRGPSVWAAVAGASTGTNVRRRRLKPQDFLEYRMPLPPKRTQQVLREVSSRVSALAQLRQSAMARCEALIPALLERSLT